MLFSPVSLFFNLGERPAPGGTSTESPFSAPFSFPSFVCFSFAHRNRYRETSRFLRQVCLAGCADGLCWREKEKLTERPT